MDTQYDELKQLRDIALSSQADRVEFHFQPSRRQFVQVLGAGILIAVCASARGQVEEQPAARGRGNRGGGGAFGGAGPANLFARLHIGKDGTITVLSGKVECGQGLRAEVTQAAAEELGVPPASIRVILADTALVPNDGATVGSQSTPRTIPPIRQAAAAAKQLLVTLAAQTWSVPAGEVTITDGAAVHAATSRRMTFADLAGAQDMEKLLTQAATPRNIAVSTVAQWKVMGLPLLRPNARDIVMGRHAYPSDVQRPGMLYGKVLRPPAYWSTPGDLDAAKAKAMKDVAVVVDGTGDAAFVGVAAPTMTQAEDALSALDMKWTSRPHPKSSDIPDYFRKNASVPANRFATQLAAAARGVKASYYIPYVQHAPMEPRAAVAEWSDDGKLTVWTASQMPFGVQQDLARIFGMNVANVRVIINDFGGGFGGKHTSECAIEAARLAKGAGKPVSLRYTREEEFTWAYFRPAGVMECEASLDAAGKITSWYFINIHSGPSAVQTPYAIADNLCQNVNIPTAAQPLRVGSYRGLAATANAWARECFMDELAAAAGKDPLEFRLAHLQDARLRAVLETVAKRFDWAGRSAKKDANRAVGIAAATEKGSYVATCAQVAIDRTNKTFAIEHLAQVFECGKIVNPAYLLSQVQGAMIQGLGPILREAMVFEDGKMQNASFMDYHVPRFADAPEMDIFLLDRPDLDSAGAGETPLIALAPAVTNALSRALGQRLRELPLQMA